MSDIETREQDRQADLTALEVRQRAMFGCTADEMRALMTQRLKTGDRAAMVALSILSDAQEQIERGQAEEARQGINRAKWIVSNYVDADARRWRAIKPHLELSGMPAVPGKGIGYTECSVVGMSGNSPVTFTHDGNPFKDVDDFMDGFADAQRIR